MHAGWGDSIQNKFTKVVWFEYFGYFVRKNAKKNKMTWLGYFREWMLTRKIKCVRLTETASVSFLTHGWIKW